jgi:hypothetical protein
VGEKQVRCREGRHGEGPAPTKVEWRSAMATLKVSRAPRGVATAMEALAAGVQERGGAEPIWEQGTVQGAPWESSASAMGKKGEGGRGADCPMWKRNREGAGQRRWEQRVRGHHGWAEQQRTRLGGGQGAPAGATSCLQGVRGCSPSL